MSEHTYRQMANHAYLPTDAGILQGDNARRVAARLGSLMLLERIHALNVKMEREKAQQAEREWRAR